MGIPKRIAALCGTLVLGFTSAITQGVREAPGSAGSLPSRGLPRPGAVGTGRPVGGSPATDRWNAWQFLVGEWTAEGGGGPGQGTGTFSFEFDLQGKVLVRRNRSDYPATNDRPAFSHQDLMIVYREPGAKSAQAIYFDNEGHVIHYTAELTADQESLVFLSDLLPSAARYRLTYTKAKNQTLNIKFEIAPPDKTRSFSTYLEGTAHRK